jgi:hypothetical protein
MIHYFNQQKKVQLEIYVKHLVPSILLEDSDNSIFGNSGELLTQAKLMHWENKAEERSIIIDAFQMLFSNFHININPCNNWSIAPIIQILIQNKTSRPRELNVWNHKQL